MECFKYLLNINISTQDKIFKVSKTTTPIQGNTSQAGGKQAGGRKNKTRKRLVDLPFLENEIENLHITVI